ncbi:MAG: hypothetical protein LBT48_02820 [Prevotellaceae bacterium]|nr:hypothetical protein [Prevotellaceae bacterium]
MKAIIKHSLTVISLMGLLWCSWGCRTVDPISTHRVSMDYINRVPTEKIPFNSTKRTKFLALNFSFDNNNCILPDRMYNDIQLTQYTHAGNNIDQAPCIYRKFAIPGSSDVLLVVSFGGITEWRTDILCIITASGYVLDTLEAEVFTNEMTVKQFRINAQNEIIISRIVPVSSSPVLFYSYFTEFMGYREDITYSINTSGKFVKKAEKRYRQKRYFKKDLENSDINIWDGGEFIPPPESFNSPPER